MLLRQKSCLSEATIFSSTDFPRLLLSADLPTLIFTERLIALYNDVAFYSNCGHFLQFAEQLMQQDRTTHKLQQSSRMSSSLKISAAEQKKHLVSSVESVFN